MRDELQEDLGLVGLALFLAAALAIVVYCLLGG